MSIVNLMLLIHSHYFFPLIQLNNPVLRIGKCIYQRIIQHTAQENPFYLRIIEHCAQESAFAQSIQNSTLESAFIRELPNMARRQVHLPTNRLELRTGRRP